MRILNGCGGSCGALPSGYGACKRCSRRCRPNENNKHLCRFCADCATPPHISFIWLWVWNLDEMSETYALPNTVLELSAAGRLSDAESVPESARPLLFKSNSLLCKVWQYGMLVLLGSGMVRSCWLLCLCAMGPHQPPLPTTTTTTRHTHLHRFSSSHLASHQQIGRIVICQNIN